MSNKRYQDLPLIPDYPLGCRRILLSDSYFPTLNENNAVAIDTIKTVEQMVLKLMDHI